MIDVDRITELVRAVPDYGLLQTGTDRLDNVAAAFDLHREVAGKPFSHHLPTSWTEAYATWSTAFTLGLVLERESRIVRNRAGMSDGACGPPGWSRITQISSDGALDLFNITYALHSAGIIHSDVDSFLIGKQYEIKLP